MSQLRITYIRSAIHCPQTHKKVIRALGLRKLQQTVIHQDNAAIQGMADKVKHLLRVEKISG
jgi:large subunit ribosomal protein L30